MKVLKEVADQGFPRANFNIATRFLCGGKYFERTKYKEATRNEEIQNTKINP